METKLGRLATSAVELSRSALEHNLKFLKARIGDRVRLSSVIKGNAYGHGIRTFLPMAEQFGIRHFSVFSADEAMMALEARRCPDTRILIMGDMPPGAMEWVINEGISFYVFEPTRLQEAHETATRLGKQAHIHLQIETGMWRLGFEKHQFGELIDWLKQQAGSLQVEGICTHFAGAESISNYIRIQKQKERFEEAVTYFRRHLNRNLTAHAASSAALLAYPDTHYDMVRIGIAQYGYWPSRETYMLLKREDRHRGEDPLKPLLRWKSRIISVKDVEEGEFVGYGSSYMTNRQERIATVPIGYSNGFGRNLSNSGYVLVRGERAGVAGNVNMNMITINVTDIPDAAVGDEVVIIGRQNGQEVSVASFAEFTNHLNYEVLTRLPEQLSRVVVA